MKHGRLIVTGMLLGAMGFLTAGCTPPVAATGPVFYPPPPDPPRLQFLVSFSDFSAWSESRSSFADLIVGQKTGQNTDIVSPYGLAVSNGKLYICDLAVATVHVIDLVRRSHATLGAPGTLKNPVNITIDADGTKYVCDTILRKVAVFDAQDHFVRYLGDPGKCIPMDVVIHGDELIVSDITKDAGGIQVWSKDGKFLRWIAHGGKDPGQLQRPTSLAIRKDGRVYVSDTVGSIVNIYDLQGHYLDAVGAPGDRPGFFARPKGLAIDPNGYLYAVESQWEVLYVFDPEGRLLLAFGGLTRTADSTGIPAGIAIDRTTLPVFAKYIDKDFEPEYLVFLSNQFGKHKIGVYAYGKSRTAKYPVIVPKTATKPIRRAESAPAESPPELPK